MVAHGAHTHNPKPGKERQENQAFKAIPATEPDQNQSRLPEMLSVVNKQIK